MSTTLSSATTPTDVVQSATSTPIVKIADKTAGLAPPETSTKPSTESAASPNIRLFIEHDQMTLGYVYKIVDSVTGAVLNEIPREKLADLSNDAGYGAGDIIDTLA